MIDYVSPLLGVRFVTRSGIVEVYGPDGKLWDTPLGMIVEANALVEKAEERAEEAEEKADLMRTDRDRMQADRDRVQAERDRATATALRLAEKLRELGVDPGAV